MTEYDGSILRVNPPLTGWTELGRTTLGSSNGTIDVGSLANKPYLMVLAHTLENTSNNHSLRLGNSSLDSGSNYAWRNSVNGGSDSTNTNQAQISLNIGGGYVNGFHTSFINNIAGEEKLSVNHGAGQNTSGAGNAPKRQESVGKWANTSDVITNVGIYDNGGFTFQANSEVVVLGWDPADTNNTPFWEELASEELTSSASSISSGTIPAKKYLWVQVYLTNSGIVDTGLTFNSDSGSNYAYRLSSDGGSDSTSGSQTRIPYDRSNKPHFANIFIINKADKEKLTISEIVSEATAGAGNAPSRREQVSKWANTSDQITNLTFTKKGSGADLDSGTTLRIWGAD